MTSDDVKKYSDAIDNVTASLKKIHEESKKSETREDLSLITEIPAPVPAPAMIPKIPKFRIKYKDVFKFQQKKDNAKLNEGKRVKRKVILNLPTRNVKKIKLDGAKTDLITPAKIDQVSTPKEVPVMIDKLEVVQLPQIAPVIEIKQEEVDDQSVNSAGEVRAVKIKRIQVSHISYRLSAGVMSFMCTLCEKSIISIELLFDHLKNFHSWNRWFGKCFAGCTELKGGSIFDELVHLIEDHIMRETLDISNQKIISDELFRANFLEKIKLVPKNNVSSTSKPPMTMIPPKSPSPHAAKNETLIVKKKETNKTKLVVCPWNGKGKSSSKYKIENENSSTKILAKEFLSKLFKCMVLECNFATNHEELFKAHLTDREKGSCWLYPLFCSYCSHKAKKIEDLIFHIVAVHLNDNIQCNLCFGRKKDSTSANNHMKTFHKIESSKNKAIADSFIILPSYTESGVMKIDKEIWNHKISNVPMVTCMSKF